MLAAHRRFAVAVTVVAAALALPVVAATPEVNLYSYRQPALIQPMLDAFTAETGIKVNIVHAEKGLLERLKIEGANSPADIVLTADVGNLNDLVEADLVQPVSTPALTASVPAEYRDPDGRWYGLTLRSRVIIASKERVGSNEIESYEDLADPRFRGRVCTRSGKHVYMVSLVAGQIAHKGVEGAEQWLKGIKTNLARKPQGSDRSQAKAIAEGECDVALVNTYYVGLMQTGADDPKEKAWAEAITMIFPDQNGNGAHVNISGAAVTKGARNRDNAIRLLEFLASDQAQSDYAARNFEYPVKPGVALSPVVAAWGPFKADGLPLAEVARHRAEATRLVDRVGFDDAGGS